MHVRRGDAGDFARIQDIERAAGESFRALGMDAVADDAPPSLPELRHYRDAGGLWVAADSSGQAAGHLLLDSVDGCTHVEQVSVHPDHARRGIGRALLDHAAALAAARGEPAVTLTAYRDVPWNAPYYERCGFRRLADSELTAGLVHIRAAETAAGLDFRPRVCMRRDIGP